MLLSQGQGLQPSEVMRIADRRVRQASTTSATPSSSASPGTGPTCAREHSRRTGRRRLRQRSSARVARHGSCGWSVPRCESHRYLQRVEACLQHLACRARAQQIQAGAGWGVGHFAPSIADALIAQRLPALGRLAPAGMLPAGDCNFARRSQRTARSPGNRQADAGARGQTRGAPCCDACAGEARGERREEEPCRRLRSGTGVSASRAATR